VKRALPLAVGGGLFGPSVAPVPFAHGAESGDAAAFGFAIALLGRVAFLTLSEQGRRVDERAA